MQRRTKGILAGVGGVVVLAGVIVGVQLLADGDGAGEALAVLPADAEWVEYVDRDAVYEAAGLDDLEHGASDSEFDDHTEDLAGLPVGTPLARYVRVMQAAAFSELAVDWYATAQSADSMVSVYRLDDDIDLGDVAEDLEDAGYDQGEVQGRDRFTADLEDAGTSGLVGDRYPLPALADVTIDEDEHLLVTGSDPEAVLDVLDENADSLADDDSVADLFDEAGDVAYASVSAGARACAEPERLSEAQREQATADSGSDALGRPDAVGTFLLEDDDDLVPLTLLGFGSDGDAEDDAAAREEWLEEGTDPVTRQPNADLYDVESVEADGSLVRVEVDHGEQAARRAVQMSLQRSGPGTCGQG